MHLTPSLLITGADAATYGFAPEASGVVNQQALQRAVDQGGTVQVNRPGTYAMAGTVYIGSHTTVQFANGVRLQKVDELGPFSHVLLNKGALTKMWDRGIAVIGLSIVVNGMDHCTHEIFGLRGQLAFHYVHDLRIERFRCLDLGRQQYCIQVCTFTDLIIDDVIIHGGKDGVHLGRGKRFRISNGVFSTLDDAIALNAHDYDTGNPELGWIEDGLIEKCHDLKPEVSVGFFARLLAGGWIDWQTGMTVQKSDSVVSHGRLYRVRAQADGELLRSMTPPSHTSGAQVLDGITWVMVQAEAIYTAGVRRVTFRDIYLENPRIGFSIHCDNDWYSRSYYPGAVVPRQEQLVFDHVRVIHAERQPLLSIGTPVDSCTISNSTLRNSPICFVGNGAMPDYFHTSMMLSNCLFSDAGVQDLLVNEVVGKTISLRTATSTTLADDFTARVAMALG